MRAGGEDGDGGRKDVGVTRKHGGAVGDGGATVCDDPASLTADHDAGSKDLSKRLQKKQRCEVSEEEKLTKVGMD